MIELAINHFLSDIPFFLLPAILPLMIKDFGLTYGGAGATLSIMSISMIVFQTVIGFYAGKYNKTRLLQIGLIILGCALFFLGFSKSLFQFLALQVLVGLGAAFYHPIGYSIITEGLTQRDRGKAYGINTSAGTAAGPIAFISSGILIFFLSWRYVFFFWATLMILIPCIVNIIFKRKNKSVEYPKKKREKFSFYEIIKKIFSLLLLMTFLQICIVTLMTFTPTLLTVNGIAIEWANIISAIMVISGVFGGILIGITSDKWGEPKTILRIMAMICILSLTLFQIHNRIVLITVICVLGFFVLGTPPAYYALISTKIEFKNLTAIYGILLSIAWGIGGLFPYIAGVIADSYGINSIFILLVVSSIASMIITYVKFKVSK